jgi:lysophospholipase L1-like esterase
MRLKIPHQFLIHYVVISLGILTLCSLIVINQYTLHFFTLDGSLSLKYQKIIKDLQRLILIGGASMIVIGYTTYKYQLFRILESQYRQNITMTIIISFYSLFLCELALRIIPLPTGTDIIKQSIHYEPSAFSIHRLKADQNIFKSNDSTKLIIRNGYRGEGFPLTKPEGEIRIFIMGGSFVFNANQDLGRDWSHLVEKYLKEAGHENVRVINAGVPGHRTFDCIGRLISEIHLFDPDYVILCNQWNDIKYFRYLSPEKTLLKEIKSLTISTTEKFSKLNLWERFIENFQITLRIKALYDEWYGPEISLEGPVLSKGDFINEITDYAIRQYRLNLDTFTDICKNINAVPILMTQPRLVVQNNTKEDMQRIRYDMVGLNHEKLVLAFHYSDKAIYDVAKQKSVNVIDLAPLFSGKSQLFEDHIHLSKEVGSKRIAREVAVQLEEILKEK